MKKKLLMARKTSGPAGLFIKISLLFFAIISCIFLPHAVLQAQPLYRLSNYTQQEGLASSTIGRIYKDSTGFIWLLTENGLTRFDGYTFKTYRHNVYDSTTISSSDVKAMGIDHEKNILFRTNNSVCKYLPEKERFVNLVNFGLNEKYNYFFIGERGAWVLNDHALVYIDATKLKTVTYALPDNLKVNPNSEVFCFNNKLFIEESRSLFLFDLAEKEYKRISIQYNDTVIDYFRQPPLTFFHRNDGSVGFYSEDGYFFYNPGRNIFMQYNDKTIKSNWINLMVGKAIVNNSVIVLALRNGKIINLNFENGKESVLDLNSFKGTGANEVVPFSVFQSTDGKAIISTTNSGIYEMDPVSNTINSLFNANSRIQNPFPLNTEFVVQDNNIVWFSSPGNGLYKAEKYKPVLSSFIPPENNSGFSNWSRNIRTISELDSDKLILGSLNGLFIFDIKSKTFSDLKSPVDGKPVFKDERIAKIIKDRNGVTWLASWSSNGVFALDYKNKRMIRLQPLNANSDFTEYSIRSMLIDSHGYLWLGTNRDLIYRINTKEIDWNNPQSASFEEISRRMVNLQHLKLNFVFAIEENKDGDILIGTQEGFYTYDYSNNIYIRYINNPADHQTLSENNVRCILEDKNGLTWIGTNGGGLNRFDKLNGKFTSFTIDNGLPDNTIYSILEDKNGLLWLGTNKGLCSFNPESFVSRNFTLEDGIQNFEFNTNAAFKTSKNYLAFGGINGFNLFHPDSLKEVINSFPLVITSLKIMDKEVPLSGDLLKLEYDENYISFQFALLSFFRNQENRYAYKLAGLDKDWVNCGDRRFVSYANLAPGRYTFLVKAANYTGVWNEPGTSITFNIQPAWWNTWYFILFIVVFCFTVVFLFYRYRMSQVNKLQQIRNRIARDLHDEVGSNLSSISIFSEVASAKAGEDAEKIKPLLNKISSYTQSSMEAISDIVWVINASNDRFENILIRMRTLAAESFENLDCKLNLQFDERLNNLKIGMDSRKNFYLIYKEALNNIVKYAGCSVLEVRISQNGHKVVMKITDNGCGFDQGNIKRGNGLLNMQKRAESLKGNLEIISSKGQGTSLLLSFPF